MRDAPAMREDRWICEVLQEVTVAESRCGCCAWLLWLLVSGFVRLLCVAAVGV